MHKKIFSVLYVLNIVFGAFFDLVFPVLLMWGLSFALTTYLSLPEWIYVPFILLGVFVGLYSMVRFILSAMAALERLEREQSGSYENEIGGSDNEQQ